MTSHTPGSGAVKNSLADGLRVLELADDAGAYVGKLLGDAGAEVTRLEPDPRPYGWWSIDPDQTVARFLHQPKRRVTVRLDDPAGRDQLRTLMESADVVIESGQPHSLVPYGISAEAEVERLPEMIWVRITPFGVQGPRASQLGSDLVCAASGGFLALAGYPGSAPVRAFGDQALRMAALHAATGLALALFEREFSALGQIVDISIQEAVTSALENALQFYDLEHVVRNRTGQVYTGAGSGLYACGDGLVYLMAGRLSTATGWANLIAWMNACQTPGAEELLHPRWQDFDYRVTTEAEQSFRVLFERFASTWRAADLYHVAQERGIVLCPVSTPADLIVNEQLAARGFFTKPEAGSGWSLGPPFRDAPSSEPVQRLPADRV